MSAYNILRAVYAFLVVLWPTLTVAAASTFGKTSTFGSTFEGVGLAAWSMVLVLSTVAGLTALLNRVGQELQKPRDDGQPRIPSLKLFVVSTCLVRG